MQRSMSRRAIIRGGVVCGGVAWLAGPQTLIDRLMAQMTCTTAPPAGELVGLVALHGDRARSTPFGKMVGGPGLDARLFTDLAKLQPDRLITPTAEVFVRTAAPQALKSTATAWSVAIRDQRGQQIAERAIDTLRRESKPMGAHLIECSGNADPDNFGLMSVAEWDGVTLSQIVRDLRREKNQRPSASAVLVSGVDDGTQTSQSSTRGASWIIPLDSLEGLGAFLAVRMNGEPLTPDHGAPVRLVVPGWYACSWIKWVNELRFVGADEPVTSQMIEFSMRTHQDGIPKLARDYKPPVIDLAAAPIRVEKRRVEGRIEYRVIGIVWGGQKAVERLTIRFSAGEQRTPFAICPPPSTHRIWSLWDYRWRPARTGVYNIALRAADPAIRTRRLDISYYVRRVVIDDV